MKSIKKLFSIFLVFVLITITIFSLAACAKKEEKSKTVTVGISQFAENAQSDDTRKGIVQGLREKGYKEGTNIIFKYENAKGVATNADKISQKFIDDNVDMIISIGSSASKSAISFTKDKNIPVVYAAVTDPISLGFTDKSYNPIEYATGTIDKISVKELLTTIKDLRPNTENIGIIFAKTEDGSKSLRDEFKFYGTATDINIVSIGINKASEIELAFNTISKKVDGLVLINDNIVATVNNKILEYAKNIKMPVYGIEKSQVENGALFGYCVNYLECGKETGRIAADVLSGEKVTYIRPHEVEGTDLYINDTAAKAIWFTIPDDFKTGAIQVY